MGLYVFYELVKVDTLKIFRCNRCHSNGMVIISENRTDYTCFPRKTKRYSVVLSETM